ncbi:hypothetical protein VTJ04DRAFT_10542 [Mycothermus thermophilus]|uniref:uncharacterized protein n=1 Tax=Humicola insolens TaxID=85995 RepID=UPI0037449E60
MANENIVAPKSANDPKAAFIDVRPANPAELYGFRLATEPCWKLDGFDFSNLDIPLAGTASLALYRYDFTSSVPAETYPPLAQRAEIAANNVAVLFRALMVCKDAYGYPKFWENFLNIMDFKHVSQIVSFHSLVNLYINARKAYLKDTGTCQTKTTQVVDKWVAFLNPGANRPKKDFSWGSLICTWKQMVGCGELKDCGQAFANSPVTHPAAGNGSSHPSTSTAIATMNTVNHHRGSSNNPSRPQVAAATNKATTIVLDRAFVEDLCSRVLALEESHRRKDDNNNNNPSPAAPAPAPAAAAATTAVAADTAAAPAAAARDAAADTDQLSALTEQVSTRTGRLDDLEYTTSTAINDIYCRLNALEVHEIVAQRQSRPNLLSATVELQEFGTPAAAQLNQGMLMPAPNSDQGGEKVDALEEEQDVFSSNPATPNKLAIVPAESHNMGMTTPPSWHGAQVSGVEMMQGSDEAMTSGIPDLLAGSPHRY